MNLSSKCGDALCKQGPQRWRTRVLLLLLSACPTSSGTKPPELSGMVSLRMCFATLMNASFCTVLKSPFLSTPRAARKQMRS